MEIVSSPAKHFYEFEDFRVDVGRRLLLHAGDVVTLTPRTLNMLLVLIQHRGTVLSKDELMKDLWSDTVVEENNLTVIISALRKALHEKPQEHRYIVTIPGRGYSFVAEVREILGDSNDQVAVPPGNPVIKRVLEPVNGSDVLRSEESQFHRSAVLPPLQTSGRKVILVSLLLLILISALTYLFLSNRSTPAETETPVRTIAVLPFRNLGGESSDEYLSLGMADALITRLGNLRQVITRPTSSVLKYSRSSTDPLAAGRELAVDALIDGRIQKLDDRIRVTVQLIRVSDGKPLWSEKFDEQFTNIFAVQDSISEQVALALALKLSSEEREQLTKRYTENTEAFQLYLKGRYFWNKRSAEGLQKASQYFQRAIERDPGYALAYAGLADCYNLLSYYSILSPKDSFPKAKAAATRALEIDESLAEAHTSLALASMAFDWDWASAEREYKRALELNPNYATAHQWYAEYLAAMGRQPEAMAEIRRAGEIDPLSLIVSAAEGYIGYFGHDFDETIRQCEKTLEMDPNFVPAHWFLGWGYVQKGMFAQAVATFQKAVSLTDGDSRMLAELGHVYAISGQKAKAREIVHQLEVKSQRQYVSPYETALVYVGLDERERALVWLRKAFEDRAWQLMYLRVEPKLDRLRADPRFTTLLRDIGLAA
ncbi:MAG: winged helix-turn-helix domain-containing protein [Pyrinomonadaceae bacterium]|nr:winged helix-turn-helix domain-containing protein [Pyrinomonadaceae bacterium]